MQRIELLLTGVWLSVPLPKMVNPLLAQQPPPVPTSKINLCQGSGGTIDAKGECNVPGQGLTGDNGLVKEVTNTLLLVAGAIAVIIIITAGIRYVTSAGDAARVKAAKDTLLYAIIGLVVVVLAYAIVNFVSTNIG